MGCGQAILASSADATGAACYEFDGLAAVQTDVLLLVQLQDGTQHSAILRPASPSFTIPEAASKLQVATDYWRLGTIHILEGVDHLLFVLALMLSVFLVYVIMAAQFESFVQPFIIMLTIPLAFFGSLLLLFLMGVSLSIVVFLGMIMLAGIVVNNAIVLVDYINTLRERGSELVEAVHTAGTVRLRPILMTTATTVLGLTPMALGLGDGAEIRTPMALAVIGGLITSTALTLIIIPTFYVLIARLTERLFGRAQATVPVAPPMQADGVGS